MRRTVPTRPWALGALVAIAVLALSQVSAAPGKKKKKEPPPPKVNETVGDLSFVVSNGELSVEGVGLVTGLDNTGADPPPSWMTISSPRSSAYTVSRTLVSHFRLTRFAPVSRCAACSNAESSAPDCEGTDQILPGPTASDVLCR